ncbi:di-heme enzyme [Marinomonas sp. A3A]|uniref:MbnH family di-heme enzyme n=1 Tax=Marinomonas sp. A3A TaxID=2065312 RepID=UPI001BB3B0A6|nr:MbnH family di-heme enzyme [Marinomonas sp. A3A]QUX90308.1 di-heme enzyme [Marinomonas sp. A3A]
MTYRVYLLCFLLYPCFVLAENYQWDLPSWMTPPPVPADNPMNREKVELGQRLFYDANLSGPGYMSCSTCHMPEHSFSEQRPLSVGVTGQFHSRNAMAIVNVAYMKTLTWANPNEVRLEDQAKVPIFGVHPIEMDTKGQEDKVILFLQRDPIYPDLFHKSFPDQDYPVSFDSITKALASFERTLISYQSPYDDYKYNHSDSAISEDAKLGEALFFSAKLGCSSCHAGVHFSDATQAPAFHNTGLYNLDGKGAYPEGNQGLYEHTRKEADKGRFRTPTLRNIAQTAPYMHDGSIATLEEVIEHYAAGGRAAQQGKASPLLDDKVRPFALTDDEQRQLIAFLNSLTDTNFIENLYFTTPFR